MKNLITKAKNRILCPNPDVRRVLTGQGDHQTEERLKARQWSKIKGK